MKIILFIIFLLIPFLLMPADWDNISFTKEFPEGISKESVMKIMSLDKDMNGYGDIGKWPYAFETYIIVVEDYSMEYHIALVQIKQNNFLLLAITTFVNDEDTNDTRFDCFDFARYAINKNTIAIGMRFSGDGSYAAGGVSHTQYLKLFVIKGQELHLIFSASMDSTGDYAGDWNEDLSRQRVKINEISTIEIGPPDATGYNTIIQNVDSNEEYYNLPGDKTKYENKSRKIKYHWIKDAYQ
jgi:hypothetical protein